MIGALLVVAALFAVLFCGVLIYQVATLSSRVKDVERQLGELRSASVAERSAPRATISAAPATAVPAPATTVPAAATAPPVAAPAAAAPAPRRIAPAPAAVAPRAAVGSPAAAMAASSPSEPRTQWEILVGTNWLNKLGVLVFVIGVALLVRYSIAHVGPAGRIAIGFAVSGTLLAIGLVVSRRERYRMFGNGLVAGGWAGIYFTTFAMHGIPAARVIDSDLLSTTLLLGVAAAMILHALSARSESMTALSFVTGYATIVLSPLTLFAAAAVVPLAAATAIVAARFGWARVALLGAVATYAVFPIRDALGAPLLIDRHSPTLYVMLGVYWLVFEVADILAAGRGAPQRGLGLFVVNVLGVLGVATLELPPDATGLMAAVLAAGGLGYFMSAVVRANLARRRGTSVLGVDQLTSTHLAIGASAALMALAARTRFGDTRAMFVTLFETELVLASALVLNDRIVRTIAVALAAATSLYAVRITAHALADTPWTDPALLQVALVAVAWFANREWLRLKAAPHGLDYGYSWAGTLIAILLIGTHGASIGHGLVLLLVGAALLEAGLRDRDEYRHQAYLVCSLATLWIVTYFLRVPPPTEIRSDAWRVLAPAAVVMAALALHLSRQRDRTELRVAAVLAAWATIGFVALFELKVIATSANAGAWALTGLALTTIGALRRSATLRRQGYVLAGLGAMNALAADVFLDVPHDLLWASVGIGALYGVFFVTRPLWTAAGPDAPASNTFERVIREAAACLATGLIFVLWVDHGGDNRVTLEWGLTAIALLTAGTLLRERTLRWCGLAGLLVCVVRLTFHDLAQLEAPARITAFVVLGLVLIGASWIYTRFRERLS